MMVTDAGEYNPEFLPDALAMLDYMTPEELRALTKRVGEIQYARRMKRHVETSWQPAMAAMSNAMLGVTHAATCRAFLRRSKGHTPFWSPPGHGLAPRNPWPRSGMTPQHGRMWTAAEGAVASEKTRWLSVPDLDVFPQARDYVFAKMSVSPLTLDARANADYLKRVGYPWPVSF